MFKKDNRLKFRILLRIGYFSAMALILSMATKTLGNMIPQKDNITIAIKKKSTRLLQECLQKGDIISIKHLKLAHELFYKKNNRNTQLDFLRVLENPYILRKDINYSHTTVLKTAISFDKRQKAIAYSNGVIQIRDLKTNRFIIAIGNLNYIYNIEFPSIKKIFLIRKKTLSLFDVNMIKTGSVSSMFRDRFPGIIAQLIYLNNMNEFKSKNFSHICCGGALEASFRFSKNGNYLVDIEYCHHRMFNEIILYDIKRDITIIKWPTNNDVAQYTNNPNLFPLINSITIDSVHFSQDQRFVNFQAKVRTVPDYVNYRKIKHVNSRMQIDIIKKRIFQKSHSYY